LPHHLQCLLMILLAVTSLALAACGGAAAAAHVSTAASSGVRQLTLQQQRPLQRMRLLGCAADPATTPLAGTAAGAAGVQLSIPCVTTAAAQQELLQQ
jgi:poly(3-hydroxybutyrate) depolymerase